VQGGPRKTPVNLKLGFAGEDFGYAIDLGLPTPSRSAFAHDPEIKRECIWAGPVLRPAALLVDRRGALVRIRDERDEWGELTHDLQGFDSMLTQLADPQRAPEVLTLRDRIRSWRFYDHFRTDADAPARQPQVGTRTPVLAHDGHDLAAALQTIREIGGASALDAAVSDAFPGAAIAINQGSGRLALEMRQHGLLRALDVRELSDGTLRYLLWIAALLTPRPPALMVLNEPETSLHPDLLPALARLIARAARDTQVWVVSHAQLLTDALHANPACTSLRLDKQLGETRIEGQGMLDAPPWHWPAR
jgi:predicted ATPase